MNEIRWYNSESEAILNKGYLLKGEQLSDAIHRICSTVAKRRGEHMYYKLRDAIEKGWMSLSSPIWANLGTERGLPISCFNVHIGDSVELMTRKLSEVIMQTKHGGGTSASIDMRPMGAPITNNGESNGPVAFLKIFDSAIDKISQGATRKGAFAVYMDIDHPDIIDFINIKSVGSDIQNLFTAVSISDEWILAMEEGDKEKRNIWAKVLESRQEKGIPYLFFKDNANRNKPEVYKELNLEIKASNLCSEIMLPSSDLESFICCLLSLNVELYDEWKDTDLYYTALNTLDAVLDEFIDKTEGVYGFEESRRFAIRHRAVGVGVLGYHSYLQKNNIPFESQEARNINAEIFERIRTRLDHATIELARELGPAPIYLEDEVKYSTFRRNTTTMAIAPTTSSSAILGQVSAGIEPYSSNYYKVGLAKGNFMRKNKYLEELLENKGHNTKEVWKSIMLNKGSVQHLDVLTDYEKSVFKTFKEISQKEIIIQASRRQHFIDQGQSLNLNIPPEIPLKEVNKLVLDAYHSGIKALYYQRSQSVAKEALANVVSCSSCES